MAGLVWWRFSAEINPRGVAECIGELRAIRAREARLNVASAPSNDRQRPVDVVERRVRVRARLVSRRMQRFGVRRLLCPCLGSRTGCRPSCGATGDPADADI